MFYRILYIEYSIGIFNGIFYRNFLPTEYVIEYSIEFTNEFYAFNYHSYISVKMIFTSKLVNTHCSQFNFDGQFFPPFQFQFYFWRQGILK